MSVAILVPILIGVLVLAGVGIGIAVFMTTKRARSAEDIEPPRSAGAVRTSSGVATLDPPTVAERDAAVVDGVGAVDSADVAEDVPAPDTLEAPSFRSRLGRARGAFSEALGSIRRRGGVDADTWDDLEEALIRADVGLGLTTELLDAVRVTAKEQSIATADDLIEAVKREMTTRLLAPIDLRRSSGEGPTIWLFVGVNGVGKTTTIGKLGHQLTSNGDKVVMAAGDTFRAAAAEQLGMWAERCGAELVRGAEGGDPSSVIFDGVAHAASSGADVVLADTAGRLHTKSNLMEELSKVRRVADKGAGEVTEVLLVLDATTGQNGLTQARQFTDAVDLTGVVLTKLDGSAKGGIVLAIQSELGIPVKLVGLGEQADDLVPFDAEQFVEALFAE